MLRQSEYIEKKCPDCGQMLRFPAKLGGMLMACPTCGKRFYSDFKLAGAEGRRKNRQVISIFEMPSRLVDRICRFFSSKRFF